MQIVIDIPEEDYKRGTLSLYFGCYSTKLHDTILNGTPLPKGHGRIWEENDIKRSIRNEYQLVTVLTGLKMVKPIIEAEKEDNG